MRQKSNRPDNLDRAITAFHKISPQAPPLAIVLGSGFGGVADEFQGEWVRVDKIPGLPVPKVAGHAGRLGWGKIAGTPVVLVAGRVHYYEGHDMQAVTMAVRALAGYGVGSLLLTNAAGSLRSGWKPGDLMAVKDHINFMGVNPLRGIGWTGEADFLDLSAVYDKQYHRWLKEAGREVNQKVHSGIYMAVSGPTYETPAEVKAFRRLGAHAVGMSTVPEAIVARRYGMRVAALSCLTNLAAGLGECPVSHDEVLNLGIKSQRRNTDIVRIFASKFAPGKRDGYNR